MRISDWSSCVCSSDHVEPVEERPVVLHPAKIEIAEPLRFADLAIVVDFGAGEQLDLVPGLPNHLRAERQCAQIAEVLIDRERQVDAAVPLAADVDIAVGDARDRKSTRLNSSH